LRTASGLMMLKVRCDTWCVLLANIALLPV
jgi:hypothetical protein